MLPHFWHEGPTYCPLDAMEATAAAQKGREEWKAFQLAVTKLDAERSQATLREVTGSGTTKIMLKVTLVCLDDCSGNTIFLDSHLQFICHEIALIICKLCKSGIREWIA